MVIRILTILVGLVALLSIIACGEPSPEQATKDAKDEARDTYDDQIGALEELDFPDGGEVESLLRLASVNMQGATCGLRTDNEVVCWGDLDNYKGFSGKFTSLSGGLSHICGLRENGSIECAGSNMAYQQGDVGQSRPPAGTFKALDAGGSHNCAISTDDSLVCWGSDSDGQSSPPEGKFKAIAAGHRFTCAIQMDDTVECWGTNEKRRLASPSGEFVQIDAGSFHTCGIIKSGAILCWGDNEDGATSAPGGKFTSVSAGGGFSCGVHEGGELSCWGLNTSDGKFNEPPSGQFTSVSIDAGNSCGIRTDGNLVCWGNFSKEHAPPFESDEEDGESIGTAQGEPQAQVSPLADSQTPTDSPAPTLEPVKSEVAEPTVAVAAMQEQATAVPISTNTPAPTPTENPLEQQKRLGPRMLLVGALGNGGILSGKYEYQDATGNKIVQGDSCFLIVNMDGQNREMIQAVKGEPFIEYIQDKHGRVIFQGENGGCTGSPAIGYALHRIGNVGD